jgi:uridine phosphorylase
VIYLHSFAKGDKQYHIRCRKDDLAEYLLVPGDPDRVPKIASFWDEAREISRHREFRTFTGKYKGVDLSALSSGIGPACIAIVVNEAARIGVKTFIRVGSCGAIQRDIKCGDLVISTAAVRLDFTSSCYVIAEYPAVACYETVLALIEACESLGITNYHVGLTATTADFYAGQARLSIKGITSQAENLIETLQKANVLNFEMEAATLFTLASLYGLKAGAICAVYANRVRNEFKPGAGEENCIKAANEAIKILADWSKEKQKCGKRWFFPSIIKKHKNNDIVMENKIRYKKKMDGISNEQT